MRLARPLRRARRALLPFAAVLTTVGMTAAVSPVPAHAAAAVRGRVHPHATPAARPATGGYSSLTPARVFDSRRPGYGGALKGGSTRRIAVRGLGGVPASGVAAVALNVTVVGPAKAGYLTVYPSGVAKPTASTVNYAAQQTVANAVTVGLGSDGAVSVYVGSGGPTNVLVDVQGWYAPRSPHPSAGQYVGLAAPSRVLDSRSTAGQTHGHPLSGHATIYVHVGGRSGVPVGAAAVVANLTVTKPSTGGYLTAYPASSGNPGTTNIWFPANATLANQAVISLAGNGMLAITNAGGGAVHVILDVEGWYAGGAAWPARSAPTGVFVATPATRLLDTRRSQPSQPFNGVYGGGVRHVQVAGAGPVPRSGVAAAVLQVSVASPQAGGYASVFPADEARPTASNMNFGRHVSTTATVLAKVGADGVISIYNGGGATNLLVDVVGYVTLPTLVVTPAPMAAWGTAPLTSPDAPAARDVLRNANRWALDTWWPQVNQPGGLMTEPLDQNSWTTKTDAVRRLGMEAYSLAVSLSTGAYNGDVAAANWAIGQIVKKVANAHISNTPNGWGTRAGCFLCTWQASLWTSIVGRAAWLDWSALPPATQAAAARMVEFEADASLKLGVRYFRTRANPSDPTSQIGYVVSPGDSGGEEDSWFALAPELAMAMFPDHQHYDAWQLKATKLTIAAWSTPADTNSGQVVNGAALSTWLSGSNLEPDGAIVNHCRLAPDYTTNLYQNVDGALMLSLSGQATPIGFGHGLSTAYAALSRPSYNPPGAAAAWRSTAIDPPVLARLQNGDPSVTNCTAITNDSLPAAQEPVDTYVAPGGPVYEMGGPIGNHDIYFPQNCDWGNGQELPFALVDTEAAAFGFGGQATVPATDAAARHLADEQWMQARFTDGSSFAPNSGEYVYVGAEEHTAQLAATLYLADYVRDHQLFVSTDQGIWDAPLAAEYAHSRAVMTVPPRYETRLMRAPR